MDKITFRKVKDDSKTHSNVFLNGKHVGYIKIVNVIKKGFPFGKKEYIFEHVNGWRSVASYSTLKEAKLKSEINVNRIENK